LRKILGEYNANATWRSVTIINLTATSVWMGIVVLLIHWIEQLSFIPFLSNNAIPLIFMYIFGLAIGNAALFTLADYMKKSEIDESKT
jgi:hypothetical protein